MCSVPLSNYDLIIDFCASIIWRSPWNMSKATDSTKNMMKIVDPTRNISKIVDLFKNKQNEVRTTEPTPTIAYLIEMDVAISIQHPTKQVKAFVGEMAEMRSDKCYHKNYHGIGLAICVCRVITGRC